MPLTPEFCIKQDDEFIYVIIKVPFIRIKDTEILTDGVDFTFYCKPYLLKLAFPHELEDCEDERCKAVYDPNTDNGIITAHLAKKEKGCHFPDLDLTTRLLTLRSASDSKLYSKDSNLLPTIEVMNSLTIASDIVDEDSSSRIIDNDQIYNELRLSRTPTYGFNLQYSNVLGNLKDELMEMIEISDPDRTDISQRRQLRIEKEYSLFDAERYLGDLYGAEYDVIYTEAMSYIPTWSVQWDTWKNSSKSNNKILSVSVDSNNITSSSKIDSISTIMELIPGEGKGVVEGETATSTLSKDDIHMHAFESAGGFSKQEKNVLSSGALRNKEFLIESNSIEEKSLLLGLADLLFSFCFDHRLTGGENNVESASNISRLSCTLSWLETFREEGDNCRTVITHSARRSLVYPYLRVWKLTRKVLTDVCKVLLLGRRCVLKCLLQIKAVFENTDTHYMLNKLFIDDYCVWIQQLNEASLQTFAKEYNNMKNEMESGPNKGKGSVGLKLEELESWAEGQDFGENEVVEEVEEDGSESEVESEEEEEEEESSEDEESEDSDDDDDDEIDEISKPQLLSQNSTIPKHLLPTPPPRTHEYTLLPPSSSHSKDATENDPLYDKNTPTASKFLSDGIQKMSLQSDPCSNTGSSKSINPPLDDNHPSRNHGNPTLGNPRSSSSAILKEDINQDSYAESLHNTWRQPVNEVSTGGITVLSSCDYENDENGDNLTELNDKINNVNNNDSTQRKKSKIEEDIFLTKRSNS